jgi:hypothetical protein
MQNIFLFFTLFFSVIAPVLVVVIIKEFYKFFTKDLDEYDNWQVDEPIGAVVVIMSMGDDITERFTRYVSFGSYNEYVDAECDSYGVLDESIYFYADYCCDDHVVGTELSDGEVIVEVLEWTY